MGSKANENYGAVLSGGFTGNNKTWEELTELAIEVTPPLTCKLLDAAFEKPSQDSTSTPPKTASPIAITAPCPLITKTPAAATIAFEFK
jgi:hypothetical protein